MCRNEIDRKIFLVDTFECHLSLAQQCQRRREFVAEVADPMAERSGARRLGEHEMLGRHNLSFADGVPHRLAKDWMSLSDVVEPSRVDQRCEV